jgi:hypothetical protein
MIFILLGLFHSSQNVAVILRLDCYHQCQQAGVPVMFNNISRSVHVKCKISSASLSMVTNISENIPIMARTIWKHILSNNPCLFLDQILLILICMLSSATASPIVIYGLYILLKSKKCARSFLFRSKEQEHLL